MNDTSRLDMSMALAPDSFAAAENSIAEAARRLDDSSSKVSHYAAQLDGVLNDARDKLQILVEQVDKEHDNRQKDSAQLLKSLKHQFSRIWWTWAYYRWRRTAVRILFLVAIMIVSWQYREEINAAWNPPPVLDEPWPVIWQQPWT